MPHHKSEYIGSDFDGIVCFFAGEIWPAEVLPGMVSEKGKTAERAREVGIQAANGRLYVYVMISTN